MRDFSSFLTAAALAAMLPFSCSAYIEKALPDPPLDQAGALWTAASEADWEPYNETLTETGRIKKDHTLFAVFQKNDGAHAKETPPVKLLLFLGPGPSAAGVTDGSDGKELITGLGKVYPFRRSDIYENTLGTGMYTENTYTVSSGPAEAKEFHYYTLTYHDKSGRYLQFLVDRNTAKVRAAAWWQGRPLYSPDTVTADALTEWGLWRYVIPDLMDGGALNLGGSTPKMSGPVLQK